MTENRMYNYITITDELEEEAHWWWETFGIDFEKNPLDPTENNIEEK